MDNKIQSGISANDMLYACVSRWKWFVVSIIICVAGAYLVIKKTAPTYLRSNVVLLVNADENNKRSSDDGLEALGLQTPISNLVNEMEMIQSPVLMEKVVEELHLDVEYKYPGLFYDHVLYGGETPIRVKFSDVSANDKQFNIKMLDKKNIIITNFNKPGAEDMEVKGTLNTKIKTPCGEITVTPTAMYNPDSKFLQEVKVSKSQVSIAANRILEHLTVENMFDKSSVVKVSIVDESSSRAEDILNKLMEVYDENWKESQNRIVENTSRFLADRIRELGSELGNVDSNIASYKSSNLMPDLTAAQSMYMNQNSATQSSIQNYNTQLSLLQYMRSYVVNNIGSNRPLPANIGIDNAAITAEISSYNTMQMQRNEMVAYAGDDHPKIRDLDQQLDILRKSIVESIDQAITTARKQVGGLQNIAGAAAGKIAASTQQERHIVSNERDQKVKETLYTFLLQEKEKNDMHINRSVSNIRVMKEAGGSMAPVSPLKLQIMLLGLAIGFGLPFILIFFIEMADTKVRSRKDIEKLTAPFIGEIPQAGGTAESAVSSFVHLFKKRKHSSVLNVFVEQNERDMINEGFRVARTNLEFMLKKNPDRKVILMTSANPGSGKSFIAANMAKTFSLVGKKMLVIDLDLRRCSISGLVSDRHVRGVADYLGHYVDDVNEIICRNAFCEGVDIIPVGTVPPNPTELLHDERLGELIKTMRYAYDYVIIDCPPIDIVADADIANEFVDMTIFVIRAGLMERDWLAEINNIYDNHRFTNICTLLNGTVAGNAYSRHRYGGYYGHYHYGYYYSSDGKKKRKHKKSEA